jgi:predicted acetyltransferase
VPDEFHLLTLDDALAAPPREEVLTMMAGYGQAGEDRYDRDLALARADYAAYVQSLKNIESGFGLAAGLVPWTTYWMIRRSDGRIVAASRLRHRLSPALEERGGHIGYDVRPDERRKGYGTRVLALTLEMARARSIGRVLVTCEKHNVASARIIGRNGGVFANESVLPRTGQVEQRYWIELAS